ncbi:hypothetical protein [Saccharicrinis fermentans]|uniref:Uncharacterized protein n=1 Tax=Saccharicrinis fermentans DSM 9555 = JCM 21142 TaxID=869213 RepID=W7XVM7_9BACT|nr:hypothetical protein [Saccharicrinis fermentans]GAF02210.1 hypothetical protein JCM21142_3839 [Saccharicrinis fermentans DSM 9555 = JCM 21142]
MKRILLLLAIISIISIGTNSSLANDCSNTYKKCESPDKTFKISSSSRSIKLRKGKKARIILNAFAGKEYYFATYAKLKVGALQFKIVSPTNNKVLYDNSAEGLRDYKVFKVENTQKLFIEVSAPNWKSNNTYECAGFLIAYR